MQLNEAPDVTVAEALRQKAGAVMLLLGRHPKTGAAATIVTKRSTKVRTHKGQISLPGGMLEATDVSIADAAKREVYEEIGIGPEAIAINGFLPQQKSLHGQPIYVVVAELVTTEIEFKLCPHEVAAVHWVPIAELSRQQAREESFNIYGVGRNSLIYQTSGLTIWGLTAKMIYSADL